ncbi:hypothetical protein L195_g063909, partial [Trifolium pratense]
MIERRKRAWELGLRESLEIQESIFVFSSNP